MLEFTAAGSPREVADRIEQCAVAQGNVSALVVPWESDRQTLSIAVTAMKGDGWAIARMAESDLARIGARPGDIVKITGRTTTVARAEAAEDNASACGPPGL